MSIVMNSFGVRAAARHAAAHAAAAKRPVAAATDASVRLKVET
jgi:hypothetical protein